MEDGLWWNETTVRLGAILTTSGWLSNFNEFTPFFMHLSVFVYMIPKRHFISVHSLRNEFINDRFSIRKKCSFLREISFRYHVNWKQTLFWIENRTSCILGWIAPEYLIWRENYVRENALSEGGLFYHVNIIRTSSRNETHSGIKVISVSYKHPL